jgi:aminoglycoside phosphotransferase (APT) family kinase protein
MADLPPPGVLAEIERRFGPVGAVTRLHGGQHTDTWRVDAGEPATGVVVRHFPDGDRAPAANEQAVLRALDGLNGLVPRALGCDLDGRWSARPTSLISALDGTAEIMPCDPEACARELARGLAVVHGVAPAGLASVFERPGGTLEHLAGPLAAAVRAAWPRFVAAPAVLTHYDYWTGNAVWHDGRLVGVIDWAGAALGPRGFDVSWCRLDLVLLFGLPVADVFLAEYEARTGVALGDLEIWDAWALARSHDQVEEWAPNYQSLGRADLDAARLRQLHTEWTEQLLARR